MPGTLYLVATPIGNLSDFSPRGAEALAGADFLAVEDTRVTAKLLNHLGLKKSMVIYHRHNYAEAGRKILDRLLAGESCALVTDAGTPAISDPGEDLVRLCREEGVPVCAIPGCCALVAALSVSGLPTGRFVFEGFLSAHRKERRDRLRALQGEERTLLFYEAPHRLRATLDDLLEVLGERKLTLCRELTKLHEEVRSTTLSEASAYYRENEPRGEFVLVVAGAERVRERAFTLEEGAKLVLERLARGERMKEAAAAVAAETGLGRSELYNAALAGREEHESTPQ